MRGTPSVALVKLSKAVARFEKPFSVVEAITTPIRLARSNIQETYEPLKVVRSGKGSIERSSSCSLTNAGPSHDTSKGGGRSKPVAL